MSEEKTYSSLYEMKLMTCTGGITKEAKADNDLVELLVKRLGASVAVKEGSSTALCGGKLCKLDPADYDNTAKKGSEGLVLPATAAALLGGGEGEGYVSAEVLAANAGYTLSGPFEEGVWVLNAPGVPTFEQADATDENGISNGTYLTRMAAFYNDPIRPEPNNPTEQTRAVISEAPPYPLDVKDWKTYSYVTCYSPAILRAEENGQTVWYAANEFSTVQNWKELATVTVFKKSYDGGKTWEEFARLPHVRWGGLSMVNGHLHFIGTNGDIPAVVVARWKDEGGFEYAEMDFDCGWTSPNPPLFANGRIYLALGTAAISAPVDADLLNKASWTVSTPLSTILTKEWFLEESREPIANRFTVMEGNILKGRDGKLYNVMRIESQPSSGYAAVVELTADGKEYRAVPEINNLLDFPTSVSKFAIRYDARTDLYVALTSIRTIEGFGDQRNVLALVYSKNLWDWEVADYLLTDRTMMNSLCSAQAHSFQYVDFDIDGDDIVMAVREAAGRANIWHDGTHITCYRIENYAELIEKNKDRGLFDTILAASGRSRRR